MAIILLDKNNFIPPSKVTHYAPYPPDVQHTLGGGKIITLGGHWFALSQEALEGFLEEMKEGGQPLQPIINLEGQTAYVNPFHITGVSRGKDDSNNRYWCIFLPDGLTLRMPLDDVNQLRNLGIPIQ